MPNEFLSSDTCIDLMQQLINTLETDVINQDIIDVMYDDLCAIYHSEMLKFFRHRIFHHDSKKKLFRNPKPFWNDELQVLWNDVKCTERLFVKAERQQVDIARETFKLAQNQFDKVYRREERYFYKTKLINLENSVSENPRDFWKMIKKLGPHKKTEIPLEVYDDHKNVVSDVKIVLSKWKSDYEKLYQMPVDMDGFDEIFYRNCLNELQEMEANENIEALPGLNDPIICDEVVKVVRSSKNMKSVGLDNLPNEIFKNDKSVRILTTLFTKLFELGLIPSLWRDAVLKPIPKGSTADPRVPLEYRGISLLSTVYKLFSSLLNKRLISWGESNDIYADEQNGFRSGRSCEDHCFVLSTIIRQRLLNNMPTFVGFVDLKKAFDCVDRQLLLYKLLKAGVNSRFYVILKSIYSCCKTAVNVNGHITDFFPSNFGVRQGDCLSTTLFLLYVNDFVNDLKDSTIGIKNDHFDLQCLLYADDLVLVSECETDLQNMFKLLSEWCNQWRMKVNIAKTAIIHFRKPRMMETKFIFKFNNEQIKLVDKYKYLGLVFHEHLDYTLTSGVLANSGGRALGAIYSKYKSNKGFGYDTYTKLFNSGVASILDYGSCIWGYGTFDNINAVQNRALRLFLGVHRFTSNLGINGDMGWVPSKIRRYVNIIRYWNRLINMDDTRLTKKVFQ